MNPLHLLASGDLPLNVVIPAVLGNILWITLYIVLIINGRKNRFVELPIFIITGDLVWEALYGFVFPLDPVLNPIIQWGIRIWCLIDCVVFALALKYANNEITTPLIVKYITPICLALFVFWGVFVYAIADAGIGGTVIIDNADLVREAVSAYLLNIVISVIYLYQYLRLYNQRVFLPSVAWLKMLGTGLTTVAVYFNQPFNGFLMILGVLVFVADVTYLVLLRILPNTPNGGLSSSSQATP